MAAARDVPAWSPLVATIPLHDRPLRELIRDPALTHYGFSPVEIGSIRTYFARERRDPTDVELAALAQSWSEHCSYKTSRPILKAAFRSLQSHPRVLGTGDAGVLRFGPGYAYALRIESHNHPSAVEPYGGAATGIGGILRDVLAVGGRPIALADPLFFGPLDLASDAVPGGIHSPRYIASGVISGIRDYGNRVGVPTVSGGLSFDPAYLVNPLVNVGCVGFLPRSRLMPNRARAAGDRIVLVGGLTGRDGLGGVAFASQELTERSSDESRGAVQLGNPIMKEPLIRACLEAYDRRLVRGVKDLGGGGLAAAVGELVHAGGFGLKVDLDKVPVREPGLLPWEIWISESQERMALTVRPRDLSTVLAIFERRDVPATDIGAVTRGHVEQVDHGGLPAARLSLPFRVEPKPLHRPRRARAPSRKRAPALPQDRLDRLVEDLVLAPDNLSRESVIRVYDHEVQGHTVVKSLHGRVGSPTHGDAAVLRPRSDSWLGLAVTVASQPWACREDPRRGAISVVEEAARNLYAVGARPDAITDCLNFGNPEDPRVLGDFDQAVRGLALGAKALGFAVPSGNVSFYNGGLGHAIMPTPVLMATGIVDDVRRAITADLKTAGDPLYLIGGTRPELGGSLWARLHGVRGISIPPPDPARLRTLGERLLTAGHRGLVRSVHDVSDGGLASTLCEMAFGGELGFSVDLARTGVPDPATALAAEGMSRWIVEVDAAHAPAFDRLFRGLRAVRFGSVTVGPAQLRWNDRLVGEPALASLYPRWRAGLGL
jgi:phosphoribosylformylglycinamidine synthase subunit PurL